MVDKKTSN